MKSQYSMDLCNQPKHPSPILPEANDTIYSFTLKRVFLEHLLLLDFCLQRFLKCDVQLLWASLRQSCLSNFKRNHVTTRSPRPKTSVAHQAPMRLICITSYIQSAQIHISYQQHQLIRLPMTQAQVFSVPNFNFGCYAGKKLSCDCLIFTTYDFERFTPKIA